MHVQVSFLPLAISQFTAMVASLFYIFLEWLGFLFILLMRQLD